MKRFKVSDYESEERPRKEKFKKKLGKDNESTKNSWPKLKKKRY